MAAKLFAPGPDPRRTGRTAGARNRFAAAFINDFLEDWMEHGKGAIRNMRHEHPDRYVAVGVAILPKEFTVETTVSELDESELELLIDEIRARRATLVDQPKMIEATANGQTSATAD